PLLAGADVPEPDRPVFSDAGHDGAVRAERRRTITGPGVPPPTTGPDGAVASLPLERVAFPAGPGVPRPARLLVVGTDQRPAVRAEGERTDDARMTLEGRA